MNTVDTNAASQEKQIPRVAFPEQQAPDLRALKWRFIGPMLGIRGSDVIGHPTNRNVFYHAGSGLFKTTDARQTLTLFMWVRVSRKCGTTCHGAMVFIKPPMAEKPGLTSV